MRLNIIWIIFRKEITEALRDRVTLLVVVLLPLLAYPLMIFALAKVPQRLLAEKEVEAPRIALWGELPAPLRDWLQHTNGTAVKEWEGAPDPVRTALLSGGVAAPETLVPREQGGSREGSFRRPGCVCEHESGNRGRARGHFRGQAGCRVCAVAGF